MITLSIEPKLLVKDRLDLRDALRATLTEADAGFAALTIADHWVELAGDTHFAPRRAVHPTRSIPEVLQVETSAMRQTPAVVLRVRLDRFHLPMVLVVVGYEASDVLAIDAVERANLRIERVLAAVADRNT